MIVRNPVKDQVAIVGVGTTPFGRSLEGRTGPNLALEAARNAILDAGLTAADIDGICASAMAYYGSSGANPQFLQEALGIPAITWDATVAEVLTEATLARPDNRFVHKGGKRGTHTEHLGFILADMQFLQRAYPDATW